METSQPPHPHVRSDGADQDVFDVFRRACPSRALLDDVCGRWGLLALVGLAEGEQRFGQLRRRIDGISDKMLAQVLHTLQRDGLVERTAYAVIPPRVDYRLTALGASAAAAARGLIDWLQANADQVVVARAAYDAAETSDEPSGRLMAGGAVR